MDEFERVTGRRARSREQVDKCIEDLEVIQSGLSKAREAISAVTTKELVLSPEKWNEPVRVIAALLPEEASVMLLKNVVISVENNNETNSAIIGNSNNNNSNDEAQGNSQDRKKIEIALPECLRKFNLVMVESRVITNVQTLSIGM